MKGKISANCQHFTGKKKPIQRSRIGNYCVTFQYHAWNHRFAVCAIISEVFRKASPYFCWCSHYNGYHSSYYYPIFGKRICNHFHFPWFCCWFQCSFPSHVPLLNIILIGINPKKQIISTIVFAHVLQICFIKNRFCIKKHIISWLTSRNEAK